MGLDEQHKMRSDEINGQPSSSYEKLLRDQLIRLQMSVRLIKKIIRGLNQEMGRR